jgi:pimeloyl-ACP methyl ester carboxylesterase
VPYSDNGGVRIHYEVLGTGPSLFLHVGAGLEWDLWKLARYTRRIKGYRMILIDPRGRGDSDRPRTLAAHRMENYVSDVIRILDDLQIDRTAFWGHSDGARVGFALALNHSSRVNALIAAGGQDEPNEYEKWRVSLAKLSRSKGMGWSADLIRKGYRRAWGRSLPAWYRNRRRNRDPEVFALNMLAWKDWIERWDMYPKIRVPSLVIAGEKEDPTGLVGKIANLMPNAKSVIISGEDHLGEFLRSDLSLRHAQPFLRENLS